MKTIFVLLLAFLGIGLFVQTYNKGTRLLLIAVIVVMLVYLYIS